MKILITLLVSGIFTNNIITFGLLGVKELEESKNQSLSSILKTCAAFTLEFLLGTIITYPVLKWVLLPLNLEFLAPLVCVALLCAVIFGAYILFKRFLPHLFGAVFGGKNLICSVAALGLCLMNLNNDLITSYPIAILYSVIAGLGFTAVSVIFYAINSRINSSDLPRSVKGLPITLIIVSLLSLAFGGFSGI
ncbi:MAG: hypothetical protein IIW94_01505 [Clostridia bacterium]|nr:hypothetical protein [Clostridia bacterium]